jgi:hypothetical protein
VQFRLRYQNRDYELGPTEFVVGRSETCQIALDDPLVSRRHATLRVDGGVLLVEDLGSRNGVRVNGVPITGPTPLVHGNVVEIGAQQLSVIARDERADPRPAAMTQRGEAFGMLGDLADKALALGRSDEAERLLGAHLKRVLDSAADERVPDELVAKAAHFALRLAQVTGKGSWFDYVVKIHAARRKPLPSTVLDELHALVRRVDSIDLPALRVYVAGLRDRAAELGPAERFVLSRLEGLERMAALR